MSDLKVEGQITLKCLDRGVRGSLEGEGARRERGWRREGGRKTSAVLFIWFKISAPLVLPVVIIFFIRLSKTESAHN